MAMEQKNTLSSSTVTAYMGYLLRNDAQAIEPVCCGDGVRVCWWPQRKMHHCSLS
jgi:hypothetical protein